MILPTSAEGMAELDVLAATVIMGWHRHESGTWYDREYTCHGLYEHWRPTQNLVQTFKVVHQMRALGYDLRLTLLAQEINRIYFYSPKAKRSSGGCLQPEIDLPLGITYTAYDALTYTPKNG